MYRGIRNKIQVGTVVMAKVGALEDQVRGVSSRWLSKEFTGVVEVYSGYLGQRKRYFLIVILI